MARPRLCNTILEDNDDWLLVDISTPKHPKATMAIDKQFMLKHRGCGYIGADKSKHRKYITAKCIDNGSRKYVHRMVTGATYGEVVDHITHGTNNFIDNRLSNLRVVTDSQNTMNQGRRANNKSGKTGVSWHKLAKKWRVTIGKDYKLYVIGFFDDKQDAINARNMAEVEFFGNYRYNGEG